MKHFHIYDVCGDYSCVDASDWMFSKEDSCATFWSEPMESGKIVATFNWANIVCVREEEHEDDEDEDITVVPSVFDPVFMN